MLEAWCHEERQPRSFRTDRITSWITEDGEVLPPEDLIRDIEARTNAEAAMPRHRTSRVLFISAVVAGGATAALLAANAPDQFGLWIFGFVIVAGPIAAIGWIVRQLERIAARRKTRRSVAAPQPRTADRSIPEATAMGGDLRGHTIVFTGQLTTMTRPQAEQAVRSQGAEVAGHISGRTTLVVVGNAPGAKLSQAKERNVPTMNEAAFRQILGIKR